jgi:ADP-heptose:LPS heptosyltransferase
VPALRAWRHAFPLARITLIGLPWARELARRLSCVDDFIAFPGCPGVPEATCDRAALRDFLIEVRRRRFDLAVQLHGDGRIVNALVASFGATQNAGFRSAQAWYPRHDGVRFVAWPDEGSEVERLLALSDALGLPRSGLGLEFPIDDQDRHALSIAWPGWAQSRPYVCLHIGPQPHSERWQAGRFAAVADELGGDGRTVVLSAGPPESKLAAAVMSQMHSPAVNLAGRTDSWMLGALLEGAECVVMCDDQEASRIAEALKCRCVVNLSCRAAPDVEVDVVLDSPLDDCAVEPAVADGADRSDAVDGTDPPETPHWVSAPKPAVRTAQLRF